MSSFGSSYGSVGRAVASDAVVQIVTSAKFYLPIVHLNRRDENKKRDRERPIFKKEKNGGYLNDFDALSVITGGSKNSFMARRTRVGQFFNFKSLLFLVAKYLCPYKMN